MGVWAKAAAKSRRDRPPGSPELGGFFIEADGGTGIHGVLKKRCFGMGVRISLGPPSLGLKS